MVIKCLDGIEQCVYPQIFSYSADYPEKVLLATIRDKGTCLCPRCMVEKDEADKMGMIRDMKRHLQKAQTYLHDKVELARKWIYYHAHAPTSSVVTKNAFIEQLGKDFNLGQMLVPDFLHEFELGVWKALFTHMVQVLYATNPDGSTIADLDSWFRQIPTFGVDTICKFAENTSEMKKLAARDFKDILQCCIAVFEDLLSEQDDNKQVLTLLYKTAEYHTYAKMHLHTESTLRDLEAVTSEFGRQIHQFREEQQISTAPQSYHRKHFAVFELSSNATRENQEPLSLLKGSFHSLRDYALFIRLFGGSDSISMQPGELAHRLVKWVYALTNKCSIAKQIGNRVHRLEKARLAWEYQLRQLRARNVVHWQKSNVTSMRADTHMKCWTSDSKNNSFNIHERVMGNQHDPAYKNFIAKLHDHIYGRFMGRTFDGNNHDDFTNDQWNSIHIENDNIYEVQTCQINYTTYDNRHDYDTINPKTHPDVMVLSPADDHDVDPFWYACVLGVFHTRVWIADSSVHGEQLRPMSFLWAFSGGRTSNLLEGISKAARRLNDNKREDWTNYYVNIFADRDIFMHHHGGGVGHAAQALVNPNANSDISKDTANENDLYCSLDESDGDTTDTSNESGLPAKTDMSIDTPPPSGLDDKEVEADVAEDVEVEEGSSEESDKEDSDNDDGQYASD
ncbi:hypothetical protein FA15DRAFT_761328 [Coprinopsis marcescibilis]|uniref:Uncharacterized protein n=1 Tax=Coprinopsis marcescibilis TaxID=230819 RepID=A0A5C3KAT4_COPMA|nr:hypothetical protein FA15DRAFT_761328 [Coprinopsis marcescibilis]